MTDNTSEVGSTEEGSASTKETSTQTGESQNTSQTDGRTELYNKAYGKGIDKGRKEFISSLPGVKTAEQLEEIVKAHNERAESEKSAGQKLDELQTSMQTLRDEAKVKDTRLERFLGREKAEAEKLYSALSVDDKAVVDGLGIPLEETVTMLKRLSSATSGKKKVGSPVSPTPGATDANTSTSVDTLKDRMRAYQKDGLSFVRSYAEESEND